MLRAITSPFKGLAAFDDSDLDALLFFGRARESETIAANLQASRLTVLHGPSGVGKSSILRAGVAHRLRLEPDVDVHILDSWAGDPGAALRAAADAHDGRDLYLILDQFEEYFVYHGDDEEFAVHLADVVSRPRVNVLIGIREDSLARLDVFKRRLPGLFGNRLRLERLDRRAAEEAIRGPIAAYNRGVPAEDAVEIEPELAAAVLDEVAVGRVQLEGSGRGAVGNGAAADRIEAPFLQLVLERLWEAEREAGSNHLRLDTLQRLGGASQIVRDHLERAMGDLTPDEQEAAAAMYHHLVTPSGTKIAHGVGDLAGYASVDEGAAENILDRLVRERILRATSANGHAARRYEIFHDVLADAVLAWRTRHEEQRRLRRAQEQHRRARIVATAAVVGLVVVAAIAVFALLERSHARAEARHAQARALAAEAQAEIGVDPQHSLALAVAASRHEQSPAIESVLRAALLASRLRAVVVAPQPVLASGPGVVAAGDANGRLRLLLPDGSVAAKKRLGAPITSVTVARNGAVAAGTQDGQLRVFGPAGRVERTVHMRGPVSAIALGRRVLAAGSRRGIVSIWSPTSPTRSVHVRGPVGSLAFNPQERLLLVTSRDRRARLVDTRSGHIVRTFTQAGFVNAAAFSPDGNVVVTGGADHTATVWEVGGRPLHRLIDATESIDAVAFSPDGRSVAAASSDALGRVYDVRTGLRLFLLTGDTNAITDIAFSSDGKFLVTASADRTIQIRMTDTGRQVAVLRGHQDTATRALFTSDGLWVVSAGADGTIRIWDPGTEPELQPLVRQRTPFVAAVRHGNGIAVIDARGLTRILDPHARRVLRIRHGRAPAPARIPAAHQGFLQARSTPAGVVTVSRRRHIISRFDTHGPLTALAFSPDGNVLASVGRDHYLRVWDATTGRMQHAVVAHQGGIQDVDFSPDGRWIVTAGPISAGVWAADTGQLLELLRGPKKPLRAALFTQDSRTIVSAGDDGTIRTYDCVVCASLGGLVAAAEMRLAALRPR